MTDRELLKQALRALESATSFLSKSIRDRHPKLVAAIRAALATPAPAQPEGFAEAEARAKRVEDVAAKYAARTEYGEVIFPGQSWMMFVADLATEAGAAASAQPEPKGTTPSEKAPGTGTTPEALGTGAQEGAQEDAPVAWQSDEDADRYVEAPGRLEKLSRVHPSGLVRALARAAAPKEKP